MWIFAQTYYSVILVQLLRTSYGLLILLMCELVGALFMRRLLLTWFPVVLLVERYQILCVLKALLLQALKQAIWNAKSTAGLVHH